MKKYFILPVLAFLTSICSGESEYRSWQNSDGNVIEAKLISLEKNQVKLRMKGGKVFSYDLSKLSEKDQEFIKKHQIKESEPKLPQLKQGRADQFPYTFQFSDNEELEEKDRMYEIDVLYYAPKEIDDQTSVICVVGWADHKKRFGIWEDIIEEGNYVLIAPEIEHRDLRRGSIHYAVEHMHGQWQETGREYPTSMEYRVDLMMDEIFEMVSASLQLKKSQFYLYADQSSASAVQQLLTIYKSDKIGAVALSNGSSYFYPDLLQKYERYQSSKFQNEPDFGSLLRVPTRLIVGEELDKRDKYLGQIDKGIEKLVGDTILERNEHYFAHHRDYAKDNDLPFNWEFVTVPDVKYSWETMAKEAFGYFNTTQIK